MAQIFTPQADSIFRLSIAGAVVVIVGAFVAAEAIAHSDYVTGYDLVQPQPVPFSHKHHAGELGIDCRFCHASVERAANAGMPSTHVCMTCHSQVWTSAAMLAPVRDSMASDQPIFWHRVYGLAEYVYFDHSVHIHNGIGCSTCHGDLDRMQMTRNATGFSMDFCMNCHTAPWRNLRPKNRLWDMQWRPPANQATLGRQLIKQYHIDLSGRLTDCSTCHR